jgi:hypothetical protein
MASLYWVGGTASWDGTAGTRWALTSGGAGGAPAPTSSDDVFFDANSGAGVVTISPAGQASCRSLNTTGFTGTLSWNNSNTAVVKIGDALGGALTIGATTQLLNFASIVNAIQLLSTSNNGGAGWPITTNGVVLPCITIGGGAGNVTTGKYVLQDNLTWSNGGTGALTIAGGTFDTNNKNLSGWQMVVTGTLLRTVTLGSSVITLNSTLSNAFAANSSVNLTFNAGTSQIVFTGVTGGMQSGTLAYYDLVFSGLGRQLVLTLGAITCHNLTSTSVALMIATWSVGVQWTLTVTGMLSLQGANPTNGRLLVTGVDAASASWPVPAQIIAAAVSLSNVDFRDIIATGAAAPWAGTSLGDMLGNSGITFAASQNRFWVGGVGVWEDTAHWSASSGGVGGATMPLSQDDVFFNAASGVGIVNARVSRMGRNLDFTGFTGTFDTGGVGAVADHYIHGSLTMGVGMAIQGGNTVWLCGRGSHLITSNSRVFTQTFVVLAPGGTYTLADALFLNITNGVGQLAVNHGTFDAANFNVTCSRFSGGIVGATAPAYLLKMGSGTWTTLNNGASAPVALIAGPTSNGAVQASTSTILLTNVATNTKQCALTGGLALTLNVLRHSGGGDVQFVGNGAIINSLIIDPPTAAVPRGIQVQSTVTLTLGSFACSGGPGMPVKMSSQNPGNRGSISMPSGTQTLRFVTIQDMNFTGGAVWVATNAQNLGNVTGIAFQHAPAVSRAFRDIVMSLGPVGYWRLGEASGNALDSSGFGRHAVLNGAVTRGAPSLIASDPVDLATTFPGVLGNYFAAPRAPFAFTSDFTYSFWINMPPQTPFVAVLGQWEGGPAGWVLGVQSSKLRPQILGTSGISAVPGALGGVVADGQPHFCVVVNTLTSISVYVDGVGPSTLTGLWTPTTILSNGFLIGQRSVSEVGMAGTLDDVAIFGRALTPEEVRALSTQSARTAASTRSYPSRVLAASAGLNAYWKLGEQAGTVAADSAPGGIGAGTYVNAPALAQPSLIPGDTDLSVAFASAASQVATTPTLIGKVTNEITIAAWAYASTALVGGSKNVFGHPQSINWVLLFANLNQQFIFRTTNASTSQDMGGAINSLLPGVRYHVTVTRAADSTRRMFINGVQVATDTGAPWLTPNAGIGYIGGRISDLFWDGGIDDVAVWNRALTPAEIASLYRTERALAAPRAGSSYAAAVRSLGAIAYWRMDELTGTAMGAFLNRGGQYLNGVTLGVPSLIPSDPGGFAVSFDGVDDYVQLTGTGISNPLGIPAGGQHSAFAWFKINGSPAGTGDNTYHTLLQGLSGDNVYPRLLVSATGQFVLVQVRDTALVTRQVLLSGQSLGLVTHHYGYTFDGATIQVYVDGLPMASGPCAGLGVGTSGPVFGRNSPGIYQANGVLDDPALWDRALTPSEVAMLYAAGLTTTVAVRPAA